MEEEGEEEEQQHEPEEQGREEKAAQRGCRCVRWHQPHGGRGVSRVGGWAGARLAGLRTVETVVPKTALFASTCLPLELGRWRQWFCCWRRRVGQRSGAKGKGLGARVLAPCLSLSACRLSQRAAASVVASRPAEQGMPVLLVLLPFLLLRCLLRYSITGDKEMTKKKRGRRGSWRALGGGRQMTDLLGR